MSIFDTVLEVVKNEVANNEGSAISNNNPLLESVISMINDPQSGGLTGLVEKMSAGGLKKEVSSWVGTGQNLPITGEQLHSALGSPLIQNIATQMGVDANNVSSNLATLLPQLIDILTPDGQVTNNSNLQQLALAGLSSLLSNKPA